MTNKSGRTRQGMNRHRGELIGDENGQAIKVVSLRQWNAIAGTYNFS